MLMQLGNVFYITLLYYSEGYKHSYIYITLLLLTIFLPLLKNTPASLPPLSFISLPFFLHFSHCCPLL